MTGSGINPDCRLPIADETIEIHKGGRTGKDALVKLTARPTFDGKIKAGKEYKLIDDAIAQGGTISELRHFVDNAGTKAVNVSVSVAAQFSSVIPPSEGTIQRIKEKFGREETEKFLKDYSIAGALEALTEREASYLLKFRSLDAIRARAVAKGIQGVERLLQRSLWDQTITDEDTTLQTKEEAKFSPKFKKPGQMELPIFKGQQFELNFGEKGITVQHEKPKPKPAEPVAPKVPKKKKVKRDLDNIQAHAQKTRMANTGWIGSNGKVVRNADEAASLPAPIRKSGQEQTYTIATDKNGLVHEILK